MQTELLRVQQALDRLRVGHMVIVVDDENRENEGDLILAAQFATPEAINFIAKEARGLICLALNETIVERLGLPMMTDKNTSHHQTPFTISVEAKTGVTTGISAYDRAHTIQTLTQENATSQDWVSPGHIFPLKAARGGVLVREGHTEAGVDLMHLAGLREAAVLCEVMAEDGTMAKGEVLRQFAKKHDLLMLSVQDIIFYRQYHETLVTEVASARLPTARFGQWQVRAFRDNITHEEHVALLAASFDETKVPLVRVHSSCLTGDVFGSSRCDCGQQLQAALEKVQAEGGVVLYMKQEGRGIGLANKIKAYALQEQGLDTVEANHQLGFATDLRSFAVAAQILRLLGIKALRVLTNNPRKLDALSSFGLEIVSRESLIVPPGEHNAHYLKTKQDKLGHFLEG